MISKEKQEKLQKRMNELGIYEADLTEKFILGSGKGGQKINKTSSCVYLKHEPTGLEFKIQQSRFRDDNRYLARRMLVDKLEERLLKKESEKSRLAAKIRRQKARRSRRTKEKILKEKGLRAEKKALRQRPFN